MTFKQNNDRIVLVPKHKASLMFSQLHSHTERRVLDFEMKCVSCSSLTSIMPGGDVSKCVPDSTFENDCKRKRECWGLEWFGVVVSGMGSSPNPRFAGKPSVPGSGATTHATAGLKLS